MIIYIYIYTYKAPVEKKNLSFNIDIQFNFFATIFVTVSTKFLNTEYIYIMHIYRYIYFILKLAKNIKIRIFQKYKSHKSNISIKDFKISYVVAYEISNNALNNMIAKK